MLACASKELIQEKKAVKEKPLLEFEVVVDVSAFARLSRSKIYRKEHKVEDLAVASDHLVLDASKGPIQRVGYRYDHARIVPPHTCYVVEPPGTVYGFAAWFLAGGGKAWVTVEVGPGVPLTREVVNCADGEPYFLGFLTTTSISQVCFYTTGLSLCVIGAFACVKQR
jgi:hypothetical protein